MNPSQSSVSIEELLEQASWLRRLAATLVDGDAAADDLVQETWLAAMTHPPRRGGPVRPWLARVLRNLASNLRRGERRRCLHESGVHQVEGEATQSDLDPRRIAEEIETQRIMAEAVLQLEEPFRTTVVLRYLRGRDSGEIARLQRVSAGTVRWRLKRALELLREDLDRRFPRERPWRAVLASLGLTGEIPLGAPTQGTALPLAVGATVMSTSTKVGIAAAVTLVGLLTAWMLTDSFVETPGLLVAGDGRAARSVGEEPRREEPAPVSTAREAVIADAQAAAEPVLSESCIVGRVVDAGGRGVAGARVVASVADPARRGFRSRFPGRAANLATLSEAGGIYSLPVPELRPFVLTAVHADFAPGLGTLAFAGERRDIVLLPGSELIVRVVAGTASARAPDGAAPGAGAFVCASIALPDSAEMLWEGEGEADGGGAIAFRGVPAGDVSVSATWQRQRAACRVTTDGRGRAACTLELRATGGIQGVVRDRASQLPIEGARVGIPYDAETITDRSGRYHLDGISLGVGVSSLEARARGYVAHSEPVVVDKGSEQQTVNFELERGVRATGTVLDRSGRAIAGATVTWTRAIDASGLPAGEHTTDARGAFEVDGLRPEKVYRLLVLAERYATGIFSCGPFDARASGAVPADIGTLTLDAAGSIAGDVVEARAGKPYFVRLHWEEDRTASLAAGFSLVETARTDSRGRFAFQALPAGSYRLALSPTARANSWEIPLAEEIVAIAAGEHRKDVVLGASIEAITGTVTKESGEAFRRCRVRLYSLSSPARELAVVYSDSDGRFRLLVHAPGPFRVVADDPQLLFDSRAIEPVAVHQDLRFVLPEFRSEHVITGRVITIAGEVPKDVFVGFTDPVTKERLSRFAIPGPDGRFEMKNLRGVAYDVESVDFLGRHETARITGVWPGRADVELRLSPRR